VEYNDRYVKSIKIPEERKRVLQRMGLKNCFDDYLPIREYCPLCLKEKNGWNCKVFRSYSGMAKHLVSSVHKSNSILNDILETLTLIEFQSKENQIEKLEELQK